MNTDNPTLDTPTTAATPSPPPPPRWAIRTAHLTVACVLPSSLWRLALAAGVPLGYSAAVLRQDYDSPGWGTLYMIALSLLSEALAFLTLGLVRPWGEVVPRWLPLLGGRPVIPKLAVTAAAIGATLLFLLCTALPLAQWLLLDHLDNGPHGAHLVLMQACYLPLMAWGPLLAAVTLSYHRRHRGHRNQHSHHSHQ
ncbi:hypothetical protein [Streptomyces inhibens]|uniref:hypothetical protein n=1 Tax=Streptomyces inhibens TaxID=2293571 RepID=UPI001EE77820|nr:hypothetical protein [Streptomyces inhibens]UKY50080.1 hypothetical protein KI385_15435 [Streptomyces inhibens]